VQCTKNSDCATGLVCETNTQDYQYIYQCVQCTKSSDCPSGDVCNRADQDNYPLYWQFGNNTCQPDCRNNPGICAPGSCGLGDAGIPGICYSNFNTYTYYVYNPSFMYCPEVVTGWCTQDSDCQVDGGGGACIIFSGPPYIWPLYYYGNMNGYGLCAQCSLDGGVNGGCPSGQVCGPWDCAYGSAGQCVTDCFQSGSCGQGTYCSDAGPIGVDGGSIGICLNGCQNSSNCGGTSPVCSDGGTCVQCNSSTDCPDWTPGCQYNRCGSCASNADCPGTEQCNYGQCQCSTSNDCPLDVPNCQDNSTCACNSNTDCPGGYVCETRYPYTVWDYNTYPAVTGGACIPACLTNADCATTFGGTGDSNPVCDTTTGFCVPCVADTDCTATQDPTKPWITPSCLGYVDGGAPNTNPPLPTGGGICGCSDTSQCNGGYYCSTSYPAPTSGNCEPACNVPAGECQQPTYNGACANNFQSYCNSNTGKCQSCLDDYDCTGLYCNAPFCSDGGTCVGCFSGDDCTTFPNTACNYYYDNYGQPLPYGSCSSYCYEDSQCPTDGGYTCIQTPNYYGSTCLITCIMGDDAGLGTVSDAGNPCPTDAPLCVPNPNTADPTTQGSCAPNFPCDWSVCSQGMSSCSPGCGYGYCENWYTCYQYPFCFC
jgi:Cys-rich repeat protein